MILVGGEPLTSLYSGVLRDMGFWAEPSTQGGVGSISIMRIDNTPGGFSMDYQTMGSELQDIYYRCKTKTEFKKSVEKYIERCLKQYHRNDDDDLATL